MSVISWDSFMVIYFPYLPFLSKNVINNTYIKILIIKMCFSNRAKISSTCIYQTFQFYSCICILKDLHGGLFIYHD